MQTNSTANPLAIITPIGRSVLTGDIKIKRIADHFREIMRIMGLDVDEAGIAGTPERVAKMYINELFSGLDPANKPVITLLEDKTKHSKMIIEKDIPLYTYCEQHFVPIQGTMQVAYISNGRLIGLSRLNKIIRYYTNRPQLLERLPGEIALSLQEAMDIKDVAVLVEASRSGRGSTGIPERAHSTITSYYGGKFRNEDIKQEFLLTIR